MTWIVVVGSTLVMLLWIIVYSFFSTPDFNEEVTILFGTMTFWSTVFLTATICLGTTLISTTNLRVKLNWICIAPRFIVKYWTTVYFPLDKDIIREMWVKGDLKDQLGLSHRKAQKNKIISDSNIKATMSDSNLEAAPMFPSVHGRSLSDLHQTYEPSADDSLSYTASPTRQTSYTNTPPMTDIIELLPRDLGVQYAQPITKPAQNSDLQVPSPTTDTPSPKGSYYSVTDIPIPSPIPSPKYQLPSGEITSTPPSRRTSIATSRATSIRGRGSALSPTSTSPPPPPSHPLSPGTHPLSPSSSLPIPTQTYGNKRTSASYHGAYEMQAYDEQAYGYSSGRTSQTSSFATAEDFWNGEEGASGPNYATQHTQMLSTPSPQLEWFDAESSQAHVASQADHDEDDRSTIVADSRRGSMESPTWEGGLAM